MQNACDFENKEVSKNLLKLKEITKFLEFHSTVRPERVGDIKEFDLDTGTSFMVGLFKEPNMAVSRVYSSAGVEFPNHKHDEWEVIIVYAGELHLFLDDKTVILKEKDVYYLKPRTSHGAYYPVESWVLCVTMPGSEDFPEGG